MTVINNLKNKLSKRNSYAFIFSFGIMILFAFLDIYVKSGPVSIIESVMMVMGLFFGPFAVLGICIGNIVASLCITNDPVDLTIFTSFFYIIFSYAAYKVWYTFMTKDNVVQIPNLNSVYYYKKFIVSIFFACLVYFICIEIFFIYESSTSMLIRNICWTVETFVYALTGGLLTIILMNMFNIPFVSMKKTKNPRISAKYFTIAFYIFAIIGFVTIIAVHIGFKLNDLQYAIILMTEIILMLFYLFKPVTADVENDLSTSITININRNFKHKINLTIIEKGILISIVLSYIFASLIVILALMGYLKTLNFESKYFSALLYASITFILFYILNFIILSKIESQVTQPLEIISETSYNYIINNQKKDLEAIIKEYDQFNDYGIEISTLSKSISTMINNLEEYVNSIKIYTKEKEKINAELSVGRNIQQSFIPKNFSLLKEKNIDIYGSVTPSREVAGDFYDFFIIDDDHVVIVVGDVSGKGIPASLFMVKTMILIKNIFLFKSSLADNINFVNN